MLSREVSLLHGVQAGLFRRLGAGDVAVDEVIVALEQAGYDGWYVLEQDCALTDGIPAAGTGPVEDAAASLAFIRDRVVPRVAPSPVG